MPQITKFGQLMEKKKNTHWFKRLRGKFESPDFILNVTIFYKTLLTLQNFNLTL